MWKANARDDLSKPSASCFDLSHSKCRRSVVKLSPLWTSLQMTRDKSCRAVSQFCRREDRLLGFIAHSVTKPKLNHANMQSKLSSEAWAWSWAKDPAWAKRDATVSTERGDGSCGRKRGNPWRWVDGHALAHDRETLPWEKKVKARLVLLGYQARDLGDDLLQAATPTPTRRAKLRFLPVATHHGFELRKADASVAFLQGREQQASTWFQ